MLVTNVLLIFYLSAAVGTISMTLARGKVFKGPRERLRQRSEFLGELSSCPYCTSHWVSFLLAALYRPVLFPGVNPFLNWFVTSMVMVFIAALVAKLVYIAYAIMKNE